MSFKFKHKYKYLGKKKHIGLENQQSMESVCPFTVIVKEKSIYSDTPNWLFNILNNKDLSLWKYVYSL